jgi:hypothetical protein
LAGHESVQLIISFPAIREILKKEIYGSDKENPRSIENKVQVNRAGMTTCENANAKDSICTCDRIMSWRSG